VTRHVPASAGKGGLHQKRVQRWTEALELMRQALKMLDESSAPSHVAPHLDLAINRLEEAIQSPDEGESPS
jgi:hypothetical protein